MENNKIWAYYIKLSDHFWSDETTVEGGMFPGKAYDENNDIDFEVWDEVVSYLGEKKYNMLLIDIGDGVKYESHPEISAPNAVSKQFLKEKLDAARALGIEPIPKLNFSTCHDTWMKDYRRMVSTSIYRKVVVDLIDEMSELFDTPSLFHLGMDEENDKLQTRNEISIIRHEKVLWEDMNIMFDACRKNHVRPWVWSDYYWEHPDLFAKYMPHDVVQSNWFYRRFLNYGADTPQYKRMMAYYGIRDLGYDQIPTCSQIAESANTIHTVKFGKKELENGHLLGFLTAAWVRTNRSDYFRLMNEAYKLYEAREKVYPETL